jgi:sensor histidine kinase YesM
LLDTKQVKQRIYISIGFFIWASIHSAVLASFGMEISAAVTDSTIANSFLLLFTLVIVYPLKYYLPNSKNILHLLVFTVLLSGVWVYSCQAISTAFLLEPASADFYSQASWFLRWAVALLIMFFAVLLRWISVLFSKQEGVQRHEKQLIELSKQTELKTLREQLHPHFLFNTLNSVSALIGVKPEKAREMVLQLSEFLRGSIVTKENRNHSLDEELRQINLYLEIEKVRFGHRLQTKIDCHETLKQQPIPALILQPLVENAVKYGLYDTTESVTICITCEMGNGFLQLRVSNPFDSETAVGIKGAGFGHKSIKRNLYLIYGRADLFSWSLNGSEYSVEIKIPVS